MLKCLYMVVSAYLILLTGIGNDGMMMEFHSQYQDDASAATAFVSGMGCSDPYCTDITHHHDCPQDCEDYNHYNCDLDCTEAEHCHRGTSGDNESGQHHGEQHHGEQHHEDHH